MIRPWVERDESDVGLPHVPGDLARGNPAVKPECVTSNSSQLTAQRTGLHVSEDIQLHGLVG